MLRKFQSKSTVVSSNKPKPKTKTTMCLLTDTSYW